MKIRKYLKSIRSAFAYVTGVRPRIFTRNAMNLKSKKHIEKDYVNSVNNSDYVFSKKEVYFDRLSLNAKRLENDNPDDIRSVLEPIKAGPQSINYGNIKCKMLHRISIRNVLDALSTVESEDIAEDQLAINTTHSSIIESDELVLG